MITNKNTIREKVDVCVVGAGHAGCEAALACARLGLETVIFTVSVDSIALMPCNPNVGGSSKGHLVRELDALGGEMGKNIDKTFIQSKMLNVSKGPAVHSLRAQADKAEYSRAMRKVLENQEHLTIRQAEVCNLLWEEVQNADPNGYSKKIIGVQTFTGAVYECRAVVLCTGTYLKARCLCGEAITYTGPNGLQAANYLTDSLKEMGIEMRRFKTGTPARMDKRSLDFSKMDEQFGDERVVPFSFPRIRRMYRLIRFPASLLIQMKKPMKLYVLTWIVLRFMPELLKARDRDIVLPLKIKWLSLQIRNDIRYLLSRKDSIRMKCMLVGCLLPFRRMCSLPCTGQFRDWSIAGWSEMLMRLNMTASIRTSSILLLDLKQWKGYTVVDSLTEAVVMKKQQCRDL